ncbi:LLM class flavin-dependent oxidoreductase [Streptosporangium vulgare]|uniref:LLM class flavin-dependent oxidoreductase n=1 Tax=Streptosporangium vulgare TaxID=46190 RepID=UPI0031E43F8E
MTSLSILDLAPVPSGGTPGDALRNTLDLARRAEEFGYRRYWVAEHHLAPGVASAAPAVLIALVAAATSTIRVGSGAVQLGHQTALSVVEQFGLVDALHPGRVDLGLGRSGQRKAEFAELAKKAPPPAEARQGRGRAAHPRGLLLRPRSRSRRCSPCTACCCSSRARRAPTSPTRSTRSRPCWPGPTAPPRGWPRTPPRARARICGCGSWAAAAGRARRWRGSGGLPFAANYHVSPSGVLDAAEAYREAFKPSEVLAEPYLVVSADVVVAEDDETARELASPYGLWVRSIRTGAGAIPFPHPGRGGGPRVDRGGPRAGRRPARHPVRRLPADRRGEAARAARRHRRRRAARHHHHPRPRRPGPLLRAARRGMGRRRRHALSPRHPHPFRHPAVTAGCRKFSPGIR